MSVFVAIYTAFALSDTVFVAILVFVAVAAPGAVHVSVQPSVPLLVILCAIVCLSAFICPLDAIVLPSSLSGCRLPVAPPCVSWSVHIAPELSHESLSLGVNVRTAMSVLPMSASLSRSYSYLCDFPCLCQPVFLPLSVCVAPLCLFPPVLVCIAVSM